MTDMLKISKTAEVLHLSIGLLLISILLIHPKRAILENLIRNNANEGNLEKWNKDYIFYIR
jgi:hypothetical protein